MLSFYITNASSGNNNNKEVSSLGSSVTVHLNGQLNLENNKKYHMRLLQANIVYCSPNVFSDKNNKLTYKFDIFNF